MSFHFDSQHPIFHVREGLSFRRRPTGEVRLEWNDSFLYLTEHEWASVVAFLSRDGENAETFKAALDFYNGTGKGSDSAPIEEEARKQTTPQLPFLYGREQGDGSFKDAMENLLADLRGVLSAANPGQKVVIDREHIDRDGFYFVARVLPYLTEVQFKAAAPTPEPEQGDAEDRVTVTDEMVEAAACTLWTMRTESAEDLWANGELHGDERAMYRIEAHLILTAAFLSTTKDPLPPEEER